MATILRLRMTTVAFENEPLLIPSRTVTLFDPSFHITIEVLSDDPVWIGPIGCESHRWVTK